MVFDDVDEFGKKKLQRVPVGGRRKVFFDGMKIPQGGIGRVVQTLLLALRKQVRDQTFVDVMRERPQNVSCLDVAARSQGQSLEADHGVAAPICKPMIAGNHGANVVSGSMRSRSVGNAEIGRDDELV